jgi:hypothetical protein
MNEERFDDLTKALAAPVSRGKMLKMVGGALLGSALGGWGLALRAEDAEAKKKRCPPGTVRKKVGRKFTCVNPLEDSLLAGALALSGVSPTAFNPTDARLTFKLSGARFGQVSRADTVLRVNDQIVPDTQVTVTADSIAATAALTDGKNLLHLESVDNFGRPLYFNGTIWAGDNALHVDLINEDGTPFRKKATVTISLVDDQAVHKKTTTAKGAAEFANVPASTVLIQATASGNRLGAIGVTGDAGTATVVLRGFNDPSPVDNNDLSKGTDGWDVGSAPVQIVPHQEVVGPA